MDAAPEQMDVEPIIEAEGVLERIVYENPENGFFVGRMRLPGAVDLLTVVGNLMAVSTGETIRVRGRTVDDRRWGKQLRIESYETILPNSVEGIEKYLGSGLVRGIGPAYAKRLVQAFGAETLRVIDQQPQRLRAVEGIGPKRAEQIRAAWMSQKAIQSIMIFLQGHGVTTGQAVRIYKAYGDKAVAILRADPYRLAEDIDGIAFAGADRIARQLGIAPDAPARLDAGLRHTLWRAQGEGHVFLPEAVLLQQAADLLGASEAACATRLVDLVKEGKVVREGDALYLPALHGAEAGCAALLKRLLRTPFDPPAIQVENALKWVEKSLQIALAPEQQDAVRRGITEKVLVITGGPGTGKTTVLRALLAILERKGVSFVLAAPTGRAAKRMEEATGRNASTLHRLLEFSPQQGNFTHNEGNPLYLDMLVIDEASMVDEYLLHATLRALPAFARLLIVGDVDQLPSVGAGNVLGDIIASNVVPTVRLKTVFRQAAEGGIVPAAHTINVGAYPRFNTSDFMLVERRTPPQAVETILEIVANRIPARFGLDPRRDVQVLSPMRRGDAGANRLNEALQAALNPDGAPLPRAGGLRVGDKVMQVRNNYELDVFNGDTGVVRSLHAEAGEIEVDFGDRVIIYPLDELDNLALAYATTVHKSQGSEYPAVVLALLPQHFMLLQRNLLYTAVTRGKQLVVIVGDSKALRSAIRNADTMRRHTRLAERLRNTPDSGPPEVN